MDMMPDGICFVNQLDLQFGNKAAIIRNRDVGAGASPDRYRIVVESVVRRQTI
jgi:hypothetical protein